MFSLSIVYYPRTVDTLATHRVDLVERLPPLLRRLDVLDGLYGAPHPRRPHAQARDALLLDVGGQRARVLPAARRQRAGAADAAHQVVHALPVLGTSLPNIRVE